jgi:hypothetical protein
VGARVTARAEESPLTTVQPVDKTCAVCGAVSRHGTVGPLDSFGAPDLDLRPAPLARWTLAEQVHRCPQCGYCARDISVATDVARSAVRDDGYRAEFEQERYPELARRYACAARILAAGGDRAGAGRAALMGAWAADDELQLQFPPDWEPGCGVDLDESRLAAIAGASEAASHCRRLALAYFEADRAAGLTFAADEAQADALLADLHRRLGDFGAARGAAERGVARGAEGGAEGLVLGVLKLELQLAMFGDADCHNLEEVGGEDGFAV